MSRVDTFTEATHREASCQLHYDAGMKEANEVAILATCCLWLRGPPSQRPPAQPSIPVLFYPAKARPLILRSMYMQAKSTTRPLLWKSRQQGNRPFKCAQAAPADIVCVCSPRRWRRLAMLSRRVGRQVNKPRCTSAGSGQPPELAALPLEQNRMLCCLVNMHVVWAGDAAACSPHCSGLAAQQQPHMHSVRVRGHEGREASRRGPARDYCNGIAQACKPPAAGAPRRGPGGGCCC
jgi:hypothetical protein